jgi:O-glycosyl hydrolase
MREKIAAHYPGTRLAITEYNYGGSEHVSGAVAQADVLGIFGREQVFAAALWDLSGGGRFVDAAFAAYCNYDGALGRFGDTAVAAATSDVQATSIYASVDAGRDDRMVLVAINKSTGPTTAELAIAHPVELTRGQSFQITAATPSVVRGPALAPVGRNSFRLELPPSSVTTVVLER